MFSKGLENLPLRPSTGTSGPMTAYAVITAGGSGQRMASQTPKPFLLIRGDPLILHTLRAFQNCSAVTGFVLTLSPDMMAQWGLARFRDLGLTKLLSVVEGGSTRQASVYQGLLALPDDAIPFVLVHDGARCLITAPLIEKTIHACQQADVAGAILAQPVRETLKEVRGGRIERTVPREGIWAMQTPQAFRKDILLQAHNKAASEQAWDYTDDAAVVEAMGAPLCVVESHEPNLKVTYPSDLDLASWYLSRREETR